MIWESWHENIKQYDLKANHEVSNICMQKGRRGKPPELPFIHQTIYLY